MSTIRRAFSEWLSEFRGDSAKCRACGDWRFKRTMVYRGAWFCNDEEADYFKYEI